MKRFFLSLALLIAAPAFAQVVGINTVSWHDKPGFNNTNPGLYIRMADGWGAGTVYNSYRRQAFYVGKGYGVDYGSFDLSLTAGVITGYNKTVIPMLLPGVGVPITKDVKARILLLPNALENGATGIHLAFEFRSK